MTPGSNLLRMNATDPKPRVRLASWTRAALLLAASSLGWAASASAQSTRIDWTPWKQLPVYHNGRIMPLDSFAREMVETVTSRQTPKLGLAGVLPDEKWKSADFEEARKLFGPDGKSQKFQPSELLLSWLLEPEKWEQTPFLIAHNEELRQKLGVAILGPDEKPLWFVSPADLVESDEAANYFDDLRAKQQQARLDGAEFRATGVDARFQQLLDALQAYQSLTLRPLSDQDVDRRLRPALEKLVRDYQSVGNDLEFLGKLGEASDVGSAASAVRTAYDQLIKSFTGEGDAPDFEAQAASLAESCAALHRQMEGLEQRLTLDAAQASSSDLEKLRPTLKKITAAAAGLAQSADGVVDALLANNSEPLRVVPALNPAALSKNRDPAQREQPWLDLQTLLLAPPYALRNYPQPEVHKAREAFEALRSSYAARDKDPDAFSESLKRFADAIAGLGQKIEPARERMEIADRDDDMLRYTAYPAGDYTFAELRYNELDPFKWTWIISFGALSAFTLGWLVRSHTAFWVALFTLIGALALACYGFYLRMLITGWAPVTGMYESVIYVPLMAAGVGVWFCLLPLTWNGFKAAWRMTALPGTWESSELTDDELAVAAPERWLPLQMVLLLPRAALSALTFAVLAVWPYAAGDRTIVNLLPNHDTGASPDFNSVLTWLVGLAVLAPTVWYLPRAILAGALSLVTVPLSLRGRLSSAVQQVYPRAPFLLSASLVATFFWLLAWYTPVLPKEFSPLQPVLRDNFWLTIHVLTIVSSYAAGALAWILGNIALAFYLFGRYRAPVLAGPDGKHRPAVIIALKPAKRPPAICADLSGYIYKTVQLAVLLLAAGTILGGLWADVSWGRFWGWDPKEVWALISCLVYLALLHARYAGWLNQFGLAAGTVAGASAITMSWYGVNFVLGEGLHSYGFVEGSQGQWQVLSLLIVNWAFVALAAVRYMMETKSDPIEGREAPEETAEMAASR